MNFKSIDEVKTGLKKADYICSKEIATVIFLALANNKPLLIEGPAGVGKTELAKAVSKSLKTKLIRLQCYEGLDESKALYEWEYAKQLLYTQMMKDKINDIISGANNLKEAVAKIASQDDAFFSEKFIQPRPLLQAISAEESVVLLIDEVDKSDPEFEAFLLEILSDFQVTIPEIGTKKAVNIPFVVLTSNNFRDMSDALKRRCIHLYIDYPERDLEMEIIDMKFPEIKKQLSEKVVHMMSGIRNYELKKKPSISETLDWIQALITLEVEELSPEIVIDTLNVICKYRSDAELINEKIDDLIK